MYWVAAATANGRPSPSLFSSLDKDGHDRMKRAVWNAFTVSSLVNYEPYVDKVVVIFLQQLRERFAHGNQTSVDLTKWVHYYSLDVIGEVVYGRAYGFLASDTDVDNMQRDTQAMQEYFQVVGHSY
jgi:cytochrome P450